MTHPAVAHLQTPVLYTLRIGKYEYPYGTIPQVIRCIKRTCKMLQIFSFTVVSGNGHYLVHYPQYPGDFHIDCEAIGQGIIDLLGDIEKANGEYTAYQPGEEVLQFEVLTDGIILEWGTGYVRYVPPRGWTLATIKDAIRSIAEEIDSAESH